MAESVLVTGGAGYIGSHACLVLMQAGYDVVVLDNLANSHALALARVEQLAGRSLVFQHGDIRDSGLLDNIFATHQFCAVMHFAGLKAVGESCRHPLAYYDNNVGGTVSLLQAMQRAGVRRMIFSSSATVYGYPACMPVNEDTPLAAYNPYGRTKQVIEQMLADLAAPDTGEAWQIALLRYFNPVGAHDSGLIGEDPEGVPNNLLPYITQVAVGRREWLPVYGDDYGTPDGTGLRDYIHVMDLVEGHVQALRQLLARDTADSYCRAFNLGTGQAYSVLEMVRAFEDVNGVTVPHRILPRRAGDVAACWADPSRARTELAWEARRDLRTMLADSWRWQQGNPAGYRR